MSDLTEAEVRELTKTTVEAFERLHISHDRLLAAAKAALIAANENHPVAVEEILQAAIAAAEELES